MSLFASLLDQNNDRQSTFDSFLLGWYPQFIVGCFLHLWDSHNINQKDDFMVITLFLLGEKVNPYSINNLYLLKIVLIRLYGSSFFSCFLLLLSECTHPWLRPSFSCQSLPCIFKNRCHSKIGSFSGRKVH